MAHLNPQETTTKLSLQFDDMNSFLALSPVLTIYPELVQANINDIKLLYLMRFSCPGVRHVANLKVLIDYFIDHVKSDGQQVSRLAPILFCKAIPEAKIDPDLFYPKDNLKPVFNRLGKISKEQDGESFIIKMAYENFDATPLWAFYRECCLQKVTPDELLHMVIHHDLRHPFGWIYPLTQLELQKDFAVSTTVGR